MKMLHVTIQTANFDAEVKFYEESLNKLETQLRIGKGLLKEFKLKSQKMIFFSLFDDFYYTPILILR